MPHVGLFKRPRLLTLTIDRSKFASGADAHEYIESNQLIKRLLWLFGFKKALKVLAFHPKDPEWPHWHVLVDIADCGPWVDIKRLWRLWRDTWGVGGCDLQLKHKFQSGERAVSYALGYLQHQSGDIPAWVLKRTRAPRAFETYGELRQAVREAAKREAESVEEAIEAADEGPVEADGVECDRALKSRSKGCTTVAERIAECGRQCSAVIETTYGDGSRYYKYVGDVGGSPGQIALATKLGLIPDAKVGGRVVGDVRVVEVSVHLGDKQAAGRVLDEIRRRWSVACEDHGFSGLPDPVDGAAVDFVRDGVAPF